MPNPTNADLMNAIIRIANDRAEDRVLLSTLRDSHNQRVAKATKAEERRDRFEADMRTQVGATRLKVDQLSREVAVMRPVVKRMRMRSVIRRGVVECFGRWWGLLTTAAVTVGGLFVWLGDHWPKLQTFFRKWLGVLLLLALLSSIAFAREDGRYSNGDPSLRAWIRGLKNQSGVGCCDTADGFPADVDWDTDHEHYRVLINGTWYAVPDEAVIHEPNRMGYAMVWYWLDDGVPKIRCFIPGAGG